MAMEMPKHQQLYEDLRRKVLGGKYGGEVPFPSEAQIARRCGYSRTTIRKALDELRHDGLISCRQGKPASVTESVQARTFGLILPGVARYEYFQPIATELTRIAQEEHCVFLFANVDTIDPERLRQNVRELAADFIRRRVAGVVYHPIEFASMDDTTNVDIVNVFRRAEIPVVLLDSDVVVPPQSSGCDVVSIDNVHAAERLAGHLLGAGAKNVNVLMLPKFFPNMIERVRGVANAALAAGLHWSSGNVLAAEPTDERAVRAFMRRRPRPESFVCQNDAMAVAFAKTLQKLGYSVPDDVMLAGFDGMDISRLATPSLTTVEQPYVELSRTVFDVLLRRVLRPKDPPVVTLLPHKLVLRASSKRTEKVKGNRGV